MADIADRDWAPFRAAIAQWFAHLSMPAWSVFCAVSVSALAVSAFALVPFMPMGVATHDWGAYLDAMWRMQWGQIPHVDFTLPYGGLSVVLPFAAQRLLPALHPFLGAELLMWLLLLPAVVVVASRLRNPFAAAGFTVLVAGAVLLPFTSDHIQTLVSYHAVYNRYGIALLLIIGVWAVAPHKRAADGWMLGYLLTLLFFIKITTFAAAFVLLGAKFVLDRDVRRAAALSLLAFALALSLIEAVSGIVSGYLRDILIMMAANEDDAVNRLMLTGYRQRTAVAVTVFLALVFAISATGGAAAWPRWRQLPEFLRRHSIPIDALLLLGAALAAESQSGGGILLLPLVALAFKPGLFDRRSGLRMSSALIAVTVLVAPVLDLWVGRSVAVAVKFNRDWIEDPALSQAYPGFRVDDFSASEARLNLALWKKSRDLINSELAKDYHAQLYLIPDAAAMDFAHTKTIAAAVKAFRDSPYAGRLTSLMALDWPDLFPRLIGTEPVRGTRIGLDAERTVALDAQGAENYLRNVDGVFVPACPIEMNRAALRRMFASALERSFEKVPLTDCWELYVRR